MELCVLGSGSGGNASLLRLGDRCVLIDAGFGPRAIAKRLAPTGCTLDDIDALLITHFDADHFRPTWFPALRTRGIRLYAHRRQLFALHRHLAVAGVDAHVLGRLGLLHEIDDDPFELNHGLVARVRTTRCAHDSGHSVGYRIDCPTGSLCYATDLGRVEAALIDAMTDADLIAIESNYDPDMQVGSARPAMLKRRIMGGRGHLANAEAANAVARALGRSRRAPHHVVLLHLSRQCNRPDLARSTFDAHPALSHLAPRLSISTQHEPTPWLRLGQHTAALPGEQLTLGF